DFLQGVAGHGAQAEGNALVPGGAGQGDVGIPVQHAVEAGGADGQRQRAGLPEQLAGGVQFRAGHQCGGQQADLGKGLAVASQGDLLLGAAGQVFPGEVGQAAAGHVFQFGNTLGLVETGVGAVTAQGGNPGTADGRQV